ncbi:hypothetical protein SEVIR_6G153250v4 [Setaria viridis]
MFFFSSCVALLLRQEALIREALGGAVVLWELVSAPFVLLGLRAVLLVMSPPLEGWSRLERIGSTIHGAGTLGMAAIYVLLRCLPEFSTDDVEARASILRYIHRFLHLTLGNLIVCSVRVGIW